jgi:serine/threonine-protein kinase
MQLSGRCYGHIRVAEQIGEGGMGAVYAGFDETLHRRVAIKVVQDEKRLDPDARRRLMREARSLSSLDHPNICRIYDYIEADNLDLLVLEYIEGKTLRAAREGGLTRVEMLRVAMDIAEALVAAHRKGIIHRDLKPENVMLTAAGQVRVLDFGLAHWVDDRLRHSEAMLAVTGSMLSIADSASRTLALHTTVGSTVGTPLFMSPEQARGEELTPASDMHSFGLLLQTLFTGKDPYPPGFSVQEVMLHAANNDSLPVTQLDRPLAELIEQLKQMAPTDRPTAAEALRLLRDLEARPKRIARRIAAAAVALLVLLAIGKYTVDLRRERASALAAEQRAVAAQKKAAVHHAQAEELINFMVGDLRKKLEPMGRLDVLDDIGARALAYSASLEPELMTGEELGRNAKALNQLGEVRMAAGRLADASEIFASARSMAAAGARKEPSNQNAQLALMAAHFWAGQAASLRGNAEEALRQMELYLVTAQRLSSAHPENEAYRNERGDAHANVGTLLMNAGRFAEAGAHFSETMRIQQARLGSDPGNAERLADLANTINKVAINLQKTGDLPGALRQFQEQKRMTLQLTAMAPDNAQWKMRASHASLFLAMAIMSSGALDTAEQEYEEALRIDTALAVTDPQNVDWKLNLAITVARLAVCQAHRGKTAKADAAFNRAETMLANLVARDPDRVQFQVVLATVRSWNAMAHLRRGDVRAAQRVWMRIGPVPESAPRAVQAEVLLAGIEIARAAGETQELSALRDRAERLFAAPPLAGSSDPSIVALRARFLVASDRTSEAAPLIARLDAISYRHPDYTWSMRGQR